MPEPAPQPGLEYVADLLLADIAERVEMGIGKYGTKLQTYNGRDSLWDAYQEVIDLAMYLRKEIAERKNIRDWQRAVHANAKEKGFWDDERNIGEMLMLAVSELSEALEAFRKHDPANFAEELADTIIRVMDMAEGLGIDLESEIAKKHEYNRSRSYMHGGKAC
jgi:NTP pyrophosphatase (non-canonical NTP hydrolase)